MFRTLSATAIGLVLLAAPTFAADHPDAEKAVRTFADDYTKAFNAKDTTAIVAMFAKDGVEAGPGPILTSPADIAKRFEVNLRLGRHRPSLRHQAGAGRRRHRLCGRYVHGQDE